MYDIEDITESMNEQGDEGIWYSVIHNMNTYRVLYHPDDGYFIFADDGILSEDDELYYTINKKLNEWRENNDKTTK